MMENGAAVFCGAGAGALLRWGIGIWIARLLPGSVLTGTHVVNIAGSFLIGIAAGYLGGKPEAPAYMRLLVMTGFLGGFTTFSTFSLEMAELLTERPWFALAVMVGKVALCLAATYGGLFLARRLLLPL